MENFLPTNNSLQGSSEYQSEISISGFNIEENLLLQIINNNKNNNIIVDFQEEQQLIEVEGLVLSSFETNNYSHGARFSGFLAVRELLDC
jgi:hypothetical protein